MRGHSSYYAYRSSEANLNSRPHILQVCSSEVVEYVVDGELANRNDGVKRLILVCDSGDKLGLGGSCGSEAGGESLVG